MSEHGSQRALYGDNTVRRARLTSLAVLVVLVASYLWVFWPRDWTPRSITVEGRGGPGQCLVMPKGPQCAETPPPLFEFEAPLP